MSEVEIVAYSGEHVQQVAAIESELNPQPWSEQLFADELTLPATSRHWLVALYEDDVVGFAGSMMVSGEAHLMNIGVTQSYQRRGIANLLLLTMLGALRQSGLAAMTLEVRPDNRAAIAMYRKFGFAPEGIRTAYYPDGQDAMIMWLHGLDSSSYGDRLEAMCESC